MLKAKKKLKWPEVSYGLDTIPCSECIQYELNTVGTLF